MDYSYQILILYGNHLAIANNEKIYFFHMIFWEVSVPRKVVFSLKYFFPYPPEEQ